MKVKVRFMKFLGGGYGPNEPMLFLERYEELPFIPFPGLTIAADDWEEKVEQVVWDLEKQELVAYVESDESVSRALLRGEKPEQSYQELLQEYLSRGWRIAE